MACVFLFAVVAILWLFIVRRDLIEGAALSNLEFWDGLQSGTSQPPSDFKTKKQVINYLKANRCGDQVDEEELAKLPLCVRSEKIERIWFGFIGLIFATSVGIFGGIFIYILFQD